MLGVEADGLAFQADVTRVATMMIGRESSIRSYDHLGLPESHHQLSHHKNDPATLAKLVKIQTYHMELFARFVGNGEFDGRHPKRVQVKVLGE